LEAWSSVFVFPICVWLAGFFNLQSFLTAIMQSTARRFELPLDKMCLYCDVTRKQKEDFTAALKENNALNKVKVAWISITRVIWKIEKHKNASLKRVIVEHSEKNYKFNFVLIRYPTSFFAISIKHRFYQVFSRLKYLLKVFKRRFLNFIL
jgi:hypothetical protein